MPKRSDFDSPWKEALEHFLAPFFGLFFHEVFAGICASHRLNFATLRLPP